MRRAGATLRCGAWASHCGGFSCCGARALGTQASVAVACRLHQSWHMGLVAPWHVESSRTRARTRVPCIGGQILNHCATREVRHFSVLKFNLGASLVAQWLRFCLSVQETRVPALVREDLTCCRATTPVCHNYSA